MTFKLYSWATKRFTSNGPISAGEGRPAEKFFVLYVK